MGMILTKKVGGSILDKKTVILAVSNDNFGECYSVSGTQTGFLMQVTTKYATHADKFGLPIFASTTHSGSYYDEGGSDSVCRINILSCANNAGIVASDGSIVYGLFHDAVDFGGTGTGVDVYVRFYADGSPIGFPSGYETSQIIVGGYTPPSGDDVGFDFGSGYVTTSGNLINFEFNEYATAGGINIVYPQRKAMSDMAEHEWFRTDFVSSWEDDAEIVEDISNLWSYTGAVDGISSTVNSWTDTTLQHIFVSDPSDLQSAVDLLNTAIGDRDYLEENYISNGQEISDSLDALDQQIKDNADEIVTISGSKEAVENFTLGALDIANKYIDLSHIPKTNEKLLVFIEHGIKSILNTDYSVSGTRISWNGKDFDGILEAGDKFSVLYWY